MKIEELQHYRLEWPEHSGTYIGHGDRPEALVIEQDGNRYELPYGQVFRSSVQCDPEHRVANLDKDPPLLRCRIIRTYQDQFTRIDSE